VNSREKKKERERERWVTYLFNPPMCTCSIRIHTYAHKTRTERHHIVKNFDMTDKGREKRWKGRKERMKMR
jgi:hypothetical protein